MRTRASPFCDDSHSVTQPAVSHTRARAPDSRDSRDRKLRGSRCTQRAEGSLQTSAAPQVAALGPQGKRAAGDMATPRGGPGQEPGCTVEKSISLL